MIDIGKTISKAIKERKWLKIRYKNKDERETYYWIYIKDINPKNKTLEVDIFNEAKSYDVKSRIFIYFDSIISAELLDLTCGEDNSRLINKIENNLKAFSFLKYDSFSTNLLNYLKDCNENDVDPAIKKTIMIEGIDLNQLLNFKAYKLNEAQEKEVLSLINESIFNQYNEDLSLCLSVLSIDSGNNSYIVCYYDVFLDPKRKSLRLHNKIRLNNSFVLKGAKKTLYDYLDISISSFMDLANKSVLEAAEYLRGNIRKNEKVSTRPSFYVQMKKVSLHLDSLFEGIESDYKENKLKPPLKAFFGLLSAASYVRKVEPSICLVNSSVNIDQMRVIYNALKYPVTYVQGPPGTGKTKTIINVIFSLLLNDKTCLITSSNNKPVDGIVSNLSFYYQDKKYKLPFLRLGNMEDTAKAVVKIRSIFDKISANPNYFEKIDIKPIINEYAKNSKEKNSKLLEKIKQHERKIELEELCENVNRLLIEMDQDNFSFKKLMNEEKSYKTEMNGLKEMTNDEIVKLFEPISSSSDLQKFFYAFRNNCLAKLNKPSFNVLKEICYNDDLKEATIQFNKFLASDENFKLLLSVFPIILDTNMSSARLGTGKVHFDLVIMDESGQCNITTSLVPIARGDNLLLVGDPNQLKPIILLDNQVNDEFKEKYHVSGNYDYCLKSILECMQENDCISKRILLRYHYRCGKKIIRFSNERYYNSMLLTNYVNDIGSLVFIDCKNNNVLEKNTAYEEAEGIVKYVKRNSLEDAMIITPFVNQKELIEALLKREHLEDKVQVGTIHALQGSEKATIIFSAALSYRTSQKTYNRIMNNYEILNVGVTRAKKKLVLACDSEAINALSDKTDDFYYLVNYIKRNGDASFNIPASPRIMIGKSNNSVFEKEFFQTVSQFCSVYKNFRVRRNVAFSTIFKDDPELSNSKQEFDCVLYGKHLLRTIPLIAFEINGGEHFGNAEREEMDKKKIEVCKKQKIKLIVVPNSFAKAYEEIKQTIIKISKDKNDFEQLNLFD